MNKKELLYELIKKEKNITSKEVTNLGYERIYLTSLEKEGKIYKIARGVYSINKTDEIDPYFEFQKNNTKIIYSCFTALNLLGYYSYAPNKIQISVPQGYNASRYQNTEVFYNNKNNYAIGTTYINRKNNKIIVYNLERTICDIVKDQNRFDQSIYNRLINKYFSSDDINYHKLLEYSKLLGVSKKIQSYLSLFKA